jgi:3-hexulose-6-phosphate synthase
MACKIASEVDILEIGTPLCKSAGKEAIIAVREICPNKLILADFKTPDAGSIEAEMAFSSGADLMTVIGSAPIATIASALSIARRWEKDILLELTGVRDIPACIKEWKVVGVDWVVYHRGYDEQEANREWSKQDLRTLYNLIEAGFKVTITGGITAELLPFFCDLPVTAFIAGRAIYSDPNPVASAQHLRQVIHRLWSDPVKVPVD